MRGGYSVEERELGRREGGKRRLFFWKCTQQSADFVDDFLIFFTNLSENSTDLMIFCVYLQLRIKPINFNHNKFQ